MSTLAAAHRGYNQQDVVTAYHLALTLIGKYDAVTVDRKEGGASDPFDDLSTRSGSMLTRRQIKSSENAGLVFELRHLNTVRWNLQIDDLVRCYRDAVEPADEYRLCATWKEPTDSEFRQLLEPVAAEHTFDGYSTKTYRLRGDAIWPEGGPPTWRRLRDATDITRQNFLDFAAHFVIELECPHASTNPTAPDDLERLLIDLLTDTIGIGRYPNHSRTPVDVATQLIQMAARARAASQTLTRLEVEAEIQLRKDFGRVAQEFPIVRAAEVKRPALYHALRGQVGCKIVVLIGAPGSGKSWAVTDLADNLEHDGHLVAHHYCYLEPGDQQVQRRITTDVLFANLIYDLIHARPALSQIHRPIYSSGPRELEELLKKGVEEGIIDEATLIVDGVDHISRVFAESRNLSPEEIDIVEELVALELPENVRLVIGSQPGTHLDPLGPAAAFIEVPDWDIAEVTALANNLGVSAALMKAGLGDIVNNFLEQLLEHCEGNPLYATFLCRQTLAGLSANAAFDPVASLHDAPVIDGQISRYYQYLLDGLERGNTTAVIAELLGLVDFGLTEQDLKAIFPPLAHHIPTTLSFLSPVLTQVSAQGGVRIYHESFLRFIVERLQQAGGSVADVIAPVIEWLKGRGFYEDAKAYRFLLPSLRRAGRNHEALEIVNAQFVSLSVYAGHPRRAIEENLKLATYIAGDETNWAALARCAELLRSCVTCFEQKLLDAEAFGSAYVAIFGAAALNERLLFDGQPTFPAPIGLFFCSLCDDAGEVPPWEAYFELNQDRKREDESTTSPDRDWEKLAVVEAHGQLRLEHGEEMFSRLSRYLERIEAPPLKYVRPLLRRVVQFMGVHTLSRLIDEVRMSAETRSVILVELARALADRGESDSARRAATRAASESRSIELIAECLTLGADAGEVASALPDLNSIDIALDGERYSVEAEAASQWVAGVKIAAVTNPQALDSVSSRIEGVGWYRAWLRFVVALTQAETQSVADPNEAQTSIVRAFSDLATDTRPFAGTPRACDLGFIHHIIHETISRGLVLLRDNDPWDDVLGSLESVSHGTTIPFEGWPDGPLAPQAFAEILLPYIVRPLMTERVISMLKRQLEYCKQRGVLYEVLANLELLIARALAKAGHDEEAKQLWRTASIHLCAYGFRKDTTIFDFIESIPALAVRDKERARNAIVALQPLVNAVVEHTDGKETKHAPAYWLGALAEMDPIAATVLLARSLVKRGGVIDWRHEDAGEQVMDEVRAFGDPLLVFFIEATLPFNGRTEDAEDRLEFVARLYNRDPILGEHALHLLAAQVQGDSQHFNSAAIAKIEAFAAARGVSLPGVVQTGAKNSENQTDYSTRNDPLSKFKDHPIFPFDASPLQLMTSIRLNRHSLSEQSQESERFVNAFGYRLVELLNRGEEDQALRLIRYLARESYFGTDATALADLAYGLERHGYTRAASVTFALAYASSRGNYGWSVLGGTKQLPWAARAFDLSEPDAARTLANEVTHLLNDRGYTAGITRHLVELVASQARDPETAFEIWYEAYEVVKHRLPDNETDESVFDEIYVPDATNEWTLSEALALLLLARVSHPELRRKTAAVAGVAAFVSKEPGSLVRALSEFLRIDTPVSSALIVLHALVEAEASPYPLTNALRNEIEALGYSQIFGLRLLAESLLERAGVPFEHNGQVCTHPTTVSLRARKKRAVLSLDWGNRVEDIAEIWADFPDLVARRFDYLWASKALKDRARSRHRAARSRASKELLETPMLFWEQELFEAMFHEVLDGIDQHLASDSEWTPIVRSEIGSRVLPRVHLHVANWHSRNPRPDIPLPADQREGVEAIVSVADAGEYSGWFRCGYFERQLLMNGFSFSGIMTVMAGVDFPSESEVFDHSEVPLAMGDAEAWWMHYEEISPEPAGFVGRAVGLDFVTDWMGKPAILAFQPGLVARLDLRAPASWQQQLALTDSSGRRAVVFRSWSVRPVGESISEENRELEGCELLMRPDVFERMVEIGAHPPSIVRWISHTPAGSASGTSKSQAESSSNA